MPRMNHAGYRSTTAIALMLTVIVAILTFTIWQVAVPGETPTPEVVPLAMAPDNATSADRGEGLSPEQSAEIEAAATAAYNAERAQCLDAPLPVQFLDGIHPDYDGDGDPDSLGPVSCEYPLTASDFAAIETTNAQRRPGRNYNSPGQRG